MGSNIIDSISSSKTNIEEGLDIDIHPNQSSVSTIAAEDFREVNELPVVDIDSNNWKGLTIAALVILVICGVIVSSVVLINPDIQSKFERRANKEKLKLDQVLQGVFSASSFNGSWISDHELMYRDISGDLVILDLYSNPLQPIQLVHNSVFRQNIVQKYSLSPDRKYLLLVYDMKKLFRHTYIAKHKIYNIETEAITFLTPPNTVTETDLQYASWGPKQNSSQIVFIFKNNIYYKESANSSEIKIVVIANEDYIFNGIPDWVYEEEILSSSNAFWWSPDGSKLCFASFNDSQVDIMQYPWYGSSVEASTLYTKTIRIRYPKPGRTNPTVKLIVANLLNSDPSLELLEVRPPIEIANTDYYFTTVSWINSDTLSITWLKRVQNYSIVSICSSDNSVWICSANYIQETNGNGWVDMYDIPVFNDGKYFLRLPNNQTIDNYRHIAWVLIKTGESHFVTEGTYDTIQILAISRDENGVENIYYLSTTTGNPGERHVYRVEISYSKVKSTPECISCDLGQECLYNTATFSHNAKYFVLECNGPGIPRIELRKTEDNSFIMTLQTNEQLKNNLENKLLPKIEKLSVNMEGYNLSVMLYLPPDFRKDEIVKYPLLIQVYGGPGSQLVTERFQINWGTYMASTKDIIYAFIDGRGSGNHGDRMMHELYLKLGTVEVEDQIAVARYLRDNLNYINKEAIGIWGWSYGGYATALALAMDYNNPVFSCGISVAPVTSWLLYDSVYTERYMGLPKDHMENYLKSDVLNRANNFKGKKYLLIHGTADDNVHVQQSMVLMKALTNANVMFQTQVYPDENHALPGVKLHLYQTMESFWDECFQLDSTFEEIGLRRRRISKQRQNQI